MNHGLRIKNKVFKNRKSSIVKRKSQQGFTLIEILVAMSVLLVIGSILISILISSLRGTNKVNSIDNVRRNGNYALEQMGKMIRYSQSFDGVSIDGSDGSYKKDCTTQTASVYTPQVIASASPPRPGFFSRIANLIQGVGNLGKEEVSSLFSKLAVLIPKFGSRDTAPRQEVASAGQVIISNNSDGFVFNSGSNPVNWTATYLDIGREDVNVSNAKTVIRFPLTLLPANATVNGVTLQVNVTGAGTGQTNVTADIQAYYVNSNGQNDPVTDVSALNVYPRASDDTTPYVDNYTGFQTFGSKSIVLPSEAATHIQAAKAAVNRFSIAINYDSTLMVDGNYVRLESTEYAFGANEPKLIIDYTTPDPTPTPGPTSTPTPTPTPGPTSTPAPPTPIPTAVPLTQYHYVKITGFDGGQTILSCVPKESPLGVIPQIASYSGTLDSIPVNLLDTSTVNIDSCTITCTQSTIVSPPTVTIQFDLSNNNSSLLSENKASVPFQTSVTVRNY